MQYYKPIKNFFVMFIILIIIFTGCSKNLVSNETDISLTDTPLTDIPLTDIPLTDIPLTDTPLTNISLTDIPLTDIPLSNTSKQIYLYGEQHGIKKILDKEFELWNEYYHNKNMRHLFIEFPYYTTEFLNIWMQADNDEILNALYDDWKGTAIYTEDIKPFFQSIKDKCPETVFHGTDVGHQYSTTGERFLNYLEQNNLKDSESYQIAQKVIEQGKYYYKYSDDTYRENMMVENFIYQFDKLDNESIMGIYGMAHTGLDSINFTGTVPCMANQLKEVYKDMIYSEDLIGLINDTEPLRIDTITIDGKDYDASYFGSQNLNGLNDFSSREFWRLENAYDDFKNKETTGSVLPYNNYPIPVDIGQIFVIDITKTDGSVIRTYYRSDGHVWNNKSLTEEFVIYSENLTGLINDIKPLRIDTITIDGKDYDASYFGSQNLDGLNDFSSREFWRLENAYDDFKNKETTENVLPYNNYPMSVETGQIFVVDITKIDGSVIRTYYRSDGHIWNDRPTTEEFIIE